MNNYYLRMILNLKKSNFKKTLNKDLNNKNR